MAELTDKSGVSDSVSFTMNGEPLDVKVHPSEQPDVKGPADYHATLTRGDDGWTWKVTDRWDKVVDKSKSAVKIKSDATSAVKAATKDLDGVVDIQTHTPWPEGTAP